jgi:hypothetical protein
MNQNPDQQPLGNGGRLVLGIFKAGFRILQINLAVLLAIFAVCFVFAFLLEDPAPVGAQRTTGLIVVISTVTLCAAISFKLLQSALRKPKAAPQVEGERQS